MSTMDIAISLPLDARVLIMAKSLRMYSYGSLAVMFVLYLSELSYSETEIGLLMTLTLFGDALISIGLTSHADTFGRRKTLLIGSVLAVATGLVFSVCTNYWVLLIAAILGVISPSGGELGPFMAIEISSISQITAEEHRTLIMAWYNLVSCTSSALGALTCGSTMHYFIATQNYSMLDACRVVIMAYTIVQVLQGALFYFLGSSIEVTPISNVYSPLGSAMPQNAVSQTSRDGPFLGLTKSKAIVLKLSLLFMMDAFAGSFVLQSAMSAWFFDVYGSAPATIGKMVFVCNLVAGVSALFAAQLANAIGLVTTMVVTHLPSNVLLILVPLMPGQTLAIVFLCARYCISQMDVPTRNAYVQGVVEPAERSAANGVTGVARSLGGSLGPVIAGRLYEQAATRNIPFFVAGGLKIVYDVLLLHSFSSLKTATEAKIGEKRRTVGAEEAPQPAMSELTPLNKR